MINKNVNNKIKVDLSPELFNYKYIGITLFFYIMNSFRERTLENITKAYTRFAFWNNSYTLGFDTTSKRIKL